MGDIARYSLLLARARRASALSLGRYVRHVAERVPAARKTERIKNVLSACAEANRAQRRTRWRPSGALRPCGGDPDLLDRVELLGVVLAARAEVIRRGSCSGCGERVRRPGGVVTLPARAPEFVVLPG